MKKILLLASVGFLGGASAQAQQRLGLYEEFSGENCGPCAASNPSLNVLLGANPSKVLLIKYQSPIPSAGPIYNAYTTVTNARVTYYTVPFAPYGRLNGTGLGSGTSAPNSPGHIANLRQADIDASYNTPASFGIAVSHQWIANGDSVRATINLAALQAFAPAGANLKLRVALIEHLRYATPPGTNGETEFHNVVREMYPNAAGTQLANAWTSGQTQTITLKGRVPSYVDKAAPNETRLVAWIQNDTDKSIPQVMASTYVPVPLDVSATSVSVPSALTCASGSATITPSVTLKNTGTTPVTSARIYYRVDANIWRIYNWTGSLAVQATTSMVMPAVNVAPGSHVLTDSVALPNGAVDVNGGNNKVMANVAVYNTAGVALPIATGFENAGALPANWLLYDANANARNWVLTRGATTNIGHSNSTYLLKHDNYNYPSGEVNYAIIPADNMPAGNKTLDFFEAYAQYQAENDRLEVVYSINCGLTWTSVWNQAGATLATALPVQTSFVPTQAQWRSVSVDLGAVPANAMIAFRATSNYGNNLYLDDVTLRSTVLSTVNSVVTENSTSLAPNPANTQSTLSFNLTKSAAVRIDVVDNLGRVIATPANGPLNAGARQVTINTADLAAGLYNIVIRTAEGNLTQRLAVVR